MKKVLLVLMLVMVISIGFVFATGQTESKGSEAASTIENKFGTPENPVTVTYLCKDVNPQDAGNPEMVKAIEEGLAKEGKYIKLEILNAPAGSYATVVPVAYRTGQISPDLIYFQGGDLPIAQEGLLEDLTPYIADSENVKNIMDNHNIERMKNYPYLLWLAPQRVSVPIVRGDWFNELDSSKALASNPTPDNYYAFFKEMKAKGLCEWPLTIAGETSRLDSMFNHAFGVESTLVKQNGKWVYSQVTEGEKNKLAFYAKLYKEGLLDNNYLTKNWETKEKAFYEGDSGMIIGTAGAVINIYNNKLMQTQGDQAEGVVLPPAKGIGQAFLSVDVTKESRGFAINVDSMVKDAAWAVLDFMASPEGRVIDKLGIEGIHYNLVDGKYVLTDQFPQWWARFWDTLNGLDTSKVVGQVMTSPAMDSLALMNKYFAADTNVLLPEEYLPLKDSMDKLILIIQLKL
ncbi:MAG: extracellular solute-binding protein [Sphaerochaetaceae bacterium]|nr:extracellular solute-binding protein [Sphaerochaetaceae bacterium]